MNKTIVYYTDNSFVHAEKIREILLWMDIPIISVSQKPLDFGRNIVVGDIGRSHLSIYKQMLIGIKASPDGVIYLCEHDNIYHPSHFDFVPPKENRFYYNKNRWRLRLEDGKASYYDGIQAVSQLVAYRGILLKYYKEIVKLCKRGFPPKHHEPGVNRRGNYRYLEFKSRYPNIDIRHDGTITGGDKFRDNTKGRKNFRTANEIPYWGVTYGRPAEFINEICNG